MGEGKVNFRRMAGRATKILNYYVSFFVHNICVVKIFFENKNMKLLYENKRDKKKDTLQKII